MAKRIVIIPAFNEEMNIASVVEGVKRYSDADIVVIDDGSKDLTAEKAAETGAFVIRHPFNMGYGVALQTGYKYAVKNRYELLVQIDGDGQHDPKYIPDLFTLVESTSCHVAIGSRFLGREGYETGLLKSIGIMLFRAIIRMIIGQKITDPTSGYQCLDRKIFDVFTDNSFPSDYPDANVIILLHRMGFSVKEMPVKMVPNFKGRGMHRGFFKLAYYFFKMFLMIFIALLRENPRKKRDLNGTK